MDGASRSVVAFTVHIEQTVHISVELQHCLQTWARMALIKVLM